MVKDKQRSTVSKGEARGYRRPGAGNMNYVRTLLKANHPQFAALLNGLNASCRLRLKLWRKFLLAAMRRMPCPWQPDHMPLRCLLVDDNGTFLEAARRLLEREGVTVVGVASSIADALREARALLPDVILVDIGLGEESGFDVACLLTQDGRAGGAEVILISTGAEADYRELTDESPAAGLLAKSELSARAIRRILDHTP
jgi:CheY-like chemotaxis protein